MPEVILRFPRHLLPFALCVVSSAWGIQEILPSIDAAKSVTGVPIHRDAVQLQPQEYVFP